MAKTQSERLLDYLKAHEIEGITTLEAFTELGISRLSARIWDLRHEGYLIAGTLVQVKDRFGETARVMRYRLIPVSREA